VSIYGDRLENCSGITFLVLLDLSSHGIGSCTIERSPRIVNMEVLMKLKNASGTLDTLEICGRLKSWRWLG
jgi:hypothetical protein